VQKLGGASIKATCADCHTATGRDLKYFNYSNFSIVARSKYHGLSEQQGKQIASYIRSLNTPAPKQARPWNPPYQPGPGIDSKPIEQWAAGAGLEAVLENDIDTLNDIFPGFNGGANVSAIKKSAIAMGGTWTFNERESRLATQFPDWKHWLPTIHPKDAYPNQYPAAKAVWDKVLGRLEQYGKPYIVGKVDGGKNLWDELDAVSKALDYGAEDGPTPYSTGKTWTRQQQEMHHSAGLWRAVKLWDMIQTYNIESLSQELYTNLGADRPDPRGWPQNNDRFVFGVSPRLTPVCNNTKDSYLGTNLCRYTSLAWYDLALVLNPGNRFHVEHNAIDWNYFYGVVAYSNQDTGNGLKEPGRYMRLMVSGLKEADSNTFGVKQMGRGFSFWAGTPMALGGARERELMFEPDQYATYVAFNNAFLGSMFDKIEKYPVADWERHPTVCWYLCDQMLGWFDEGLKLYQQYGIDQTVINRIADRINSLYYTNQLDKYKK
jgi:hypothetical protein